MAEAVAETEQKTTAEAVEDALRVYEVGYHIAPTVKDEEVEKVVGGIRAAIEKSGGSFIAEGAPSLLKLAYQIEVRENGKRTRYDRAHFGWIKFEVTTEGAKAVSHAVKNEKDIIRSLVFRTVREDTRAKMKAPTLREVKRTDTIRSSVRRGEAAEKGPVSEEQLDAALDVLTAD
ncbi:hypothetical protein COU20_00850 [Candidatus Kaiserbacteria bacterium CG10_big_fil_rev_8_21_14_0_10_59_10]|uniref:Small ribosomal subunit protein bS6 n=1 Tax=Candidatus Kaiserbacteria bacterium CG10_big_fil_rev_8_21_14_0_10_59_10 TaxID=1974612 RepID=A0A2H0U8H8_9BACT|nr:MAG: hypothetical protein COU20_00850 [Candidatus Kaiserbacteria bacterium CG10_big_fil_rev_8_21_14_0_10_59_10]